eukprot:1139287-Pelagomonas_calceolata.AAC.4
MLDNNQRALRKNPAVSALTKSHQLEASHDYSTFPLTIVLTNPPFSPTLQYVKGIISRLAIGTQPYHRQLSCITI